MGTDLSADEGCSDRESTQIPSSPVVTDQVEDKDSGYGAELRSKRKLVRFPTNEEDSSSCQQAEDHGPDRPKSCPISGTTDSTTRHHGNNNNNVKPRKKTSLFSSFRSSKKNTSSGRESSEDNSGGGKKKKKKRTKQISENHQQPVTNSTLVAPKPSFVLRGKRQNSMTSIRSTEDDENR
eukprot:sb/3471701/